MRALEQKVVARKPCQKVDQTNCENSNAREKWQKLKRDYALGFLRVIESKIDDDVTIGQLVHKKMLVDTIGISLSPRLVTMPHKRCQKTAWTSWVRSQDGTVSANST